MNARRIRNGLALMLAAACVSAAPAHAAPPQRIMSLNLCTDQLLVDLVAPERIAAVSILASDPTLSAAARRLKGFRTTAGATEDVLSLDADLVVTVQYTFPATLDLLRRLGRRVAVIPLATDFASIRDSIRDLAAAVEAPERGAAVMAAFDQRLSALTAPPSNNTQPTALSVEIGSLTAGAGSLLDAVLTAAGFSNAAARRRLGPAGRLPLESLVADPPDVIVLENEPASYRTAAADNLRHPALRTLLATHPHVLLPAPLTICGSPAVLEAVSLLKAARDSLTERRRPQG